MTKTVIQEYIKYLIIEEKEWQIFKQNKATMEIISTIFKRVKNKAEWLMEVEKEQIIMAYHNGYSDAIKVEPKQYEPEQYYNETYGDKKVK